MHTAFALLPGLLEAAGVPQLAEVPPARCLPLWGLLPGSSCCAGLGYSQDLLISFKTPLSNKASLWVTGAKISTRHYLSRDTI